MPALTPAGDVADPRPLPVIVLADNSGSMAMDGKIGTLNRVLRELTASFAAESRPDRGGEILLAMITCGGPARLHTPLQPAPQVGRQDLAANGPTMLAPALTLAGELLRTGLPRGAYRPYLILLSDGYPAASDPWLEALDALGQNGRNGGHERLAVRIGADADDEMLQSFVGGRPANLFGPQDSLQLVKVLGRTLAERRSGEAGGDGHFPALLDQAPDDLEQSLFD